MGPFREDYANYSIGGELLPRWKKVCQNASGLSMKTGLSLKPPGGAPHPGDLPAEYPDPARRIEQDPRGLGQGTGEKGTRPSQTDYRSGRAG